MSGTLTQEIASFVAGVTYAGLPAVAVDRVRFGFIDCVAVMLAGRDEPAVRIVARAAGGGRDGGARLFLGDERTAGERAALVNGVAAHVLDYDDVALDGHPSAVLVPALLALADEIGSDGRSLITAYAAGYEVWAELLARDPDYLHNKGWHPTTVMGAPAAAAACAVLLGLDARRTGHALAIAASMSAGVVANFGSMTKSFQVGRAAQAGLLAARLAEAGLTGADDALEHPRGLLAALSPAGAVDRESPPALGREWRIERLGLNVKKYPVCYCAHRAGDAILDLLAASPQAPENIEAIDAYVGETSLNTLRNTAPTSALEAKFSIEFALASALHAGRIGLAELSDDFVTRADVQQTMGKVVRHPLPDDPEANLPVSTFDQVCLRLADGGVLESARVAHARGSPAAPLATGEVQAKFDDCTRTLPRDAAGRLFDALQHLETLASSHELTA
jgi:2-methylcitrate dehydratase PrpD